MPSFMCYAAVARGACCRRTSVRVRRFGATSRHGATMACRRASSTANLSRPRRAAARGASTRPRAASVTSSPTPAVCRLDRRFTPPMRRTGMAPRYPGHGASRLSVAASCLRRQRLCRARTRGGAEADRAVDAGHRRTLGRCAEVSKCGPAAGRSNAHWPGSIATGVSPGTSRRKSPQPGRSSSSPASNSLSDISQDIENQ